MSTSRSGKRKRKKKTKKNLEGSGWDVKSLHEIL